jgi:hypothetical protein
VTALAQGSAGLALVMCFALLGLRQAAAASVLLAVQSLAVAIAALAQHQPMIAAATMVIDVIGAHWFLRHQVPAQHEAPVGGTKITIVVGAGLAVLCQSCGALALPLAVVLLSVLLAATRPNRLLSLMALVSLQNGLVLVACLAPRPPLQALASFILPLPFVIGLTLGDLRQREPTLPAWLQRWPGWAQFGISVVIFLTTLTIPLDPIAAVFAPLIGVWGVAEAWQARNRTAQGVVHRALALLKLGAILLAVCAPDPIVAWIAVTTTVAAGLLPTLPRQWEGLLLASCGAGLALFGLLTISTGLASISYTSLFVGYALVAAAVPDLGVVILILILRLGMQSRLPPLADDVLIGVALVGLLACTVLLAMKTARRHRLTLLQLGQTAIAAVAVGIGLPQARFAGVILLILLILTRAAARIADGPAAIAARAGLSGIPPFGVFPGLVLVLLAISSHAPWLLLPVGLALVAMLAAGTPTSRLTSSRWTWRTSGSLGLLPLALAFVFGFVAPDNFIEWLRAMTAAAP